MRIWKKRTMAVIIILSTAAFTYMLIQSGRPRGVEVDTAQVRRGDISTYLSANGIIQSKNKKDYFVYTPAKVEKVYVAVGDKVEPDELLIKLEVPDLSYELKKAYLQMDTAKTALDSLRKRKSEEDSIIPEGFPVGSIGTAQLSSLDDQIRIQEQQVQAAKIGVDMIKEKINNAQWGIKSDIRGIVTSINAEDGSVASLGMPVITVEGTENLKAVLNISQYDALNIVPGQQASVKLGGGAKEYSGIVERINPLKRNTPSVIGAAADSGIPVDIGIVNPDDDSRIGFDVDVNITTSVRKNVLYVPYEAVLKDKNNDVRVYILKNGRAYIRDIKTGAESDFYVEVSQNLDEGETVILNPPVGLNDGDPVRVKNTERNR